MCSVSEEENKKWLSILQNWKEKEQSDPLALLFSEQTSLSVLEEYKDLQNELTCYLKELTKWLTQCGVTAAFQQMPMTGRLLSQLCKLSIIHLNSSLSSEVINCVLALSNLLDTEARGSISNAHKRAQTWSIEHFSKMAFTPVHSLDSFIMEDFGISQEEYVTEHIRQMEKSVFELYKASDWNSANTFAIKGDFISVLETVEKAQQKECYGDFPALNVIAEIHVDCLDELFTHDFSAFEDYFVSIIVQCVKMFPASDDEIANDCIVVTKLLQLCQRDEKYFQAAVQIIKSSVAADDGNAAVVRLSANLTRLYEEKTKTSFTLFD